MMKFTKLQATGNDFILIEADRMRRDWAKLAQAMCDRRFGVGSDGLILLLKSKVADFRMRMFNPDGSEAEVCGNGLRCFARYVVSSGPADARRSITIETSAGIKTALPQDRGSRFQVDMGEPRFRPEDLPVAVTVNRVPMVDYPVNVAGKKLRLTFVSMGNPHGVCFVDDVGEFPLCDIGPRVEHHELFPRRVNFEIAHVVSRREIDARVWERGAGETLSCGTGACAIAVAARLHDYVDSPVDIRLPGGTLSVKWDRKGSVYLTGPAELVFTGDWPDRKPSEDK
jgi:diaminopimelate epimerase